jgi:hypothetical protein
VLRSPLLDEPGLTQDAQMTADGRCRDRKGAVELGRRVRTAREELEDPSPRTVGEGEQQVRATLIIKLDTYQLREIYSAWRRSTSRDERH